MAKDKVHESIAIEHMESYREDTRPVENAIEEFIQSEKAISTGQAIKTHKQILGYALFSFACAMNYGYDTISNGSSIVMPAFIISFAAVDETTGSLYLPSLWTSLWTSMSDLGQAIGAFMAGVLGKTVGRRCTALIFAVMSVVGTFLLFFATSRDMLLVGKTINGLVVGGLMSIGTMYAADIAPIKLRGALLQAIVFSAVAIEGVSLGMVRAFVPDPRPVVWKIVFSIQWIFAVLVIVLSLVVPESPVFCAAKGKVEQSRHALRPLHGNDPDLELRYQSILHALEEERRQQDASASWTELFKGSNLKRTLTIAFIMFSTSAIGIPFLTQNIYFHFTVGLAAISVFDIGIGGFFLGAFLLFSVGWSNDKIGRRRLWIYGLIGNFVCMVTVGGLACSRTQGSYWAIGVIMNLLVSYGVYATVGVAWTICPEISSHRLRQYSQSVSFFTGAVGGCLFSFVTLYMYNVDSGNLGAKTGFIYARLTVIVFAISWFIIPETANLSIEDIDNAYEKGTSPREFGKLLAE